MVSVKKIILLLSVVLLTGCMTAPKYNLDYSTSTYKQITNEITVNDTFENTWKKLVGEMSKSFYVINNIDKDSNLINLSFSISDNVDDYVDCGESTRVFSLAELKEKVTYKTAGRAESYLSGTQHRAPPNTTYFREYRIPNLEGRANVYVASDGNKTLVRVNTRYIWTPKSKFQEYMYMPLYETHNIVGGIETITSDPISFNTNTSGDGDDGLVCFATGKFEKQILDIVR